MHTWTDRQRVSGKRGLGAGIVHDSTAAQKARTGKRYQAERSPGACNWVLAPTGSESRHVSSLLARSGTPVQALIFHLVFMNKVVPGCHVSVSRHLPPGRLVGE